VVSALIEVAAGGISLFSPSSIPSFSKVSLWVPPQNQDQPAASIIN
jgi:hypothetical protein